jgi:HEPN domain-containing protein
MQPQPDEEARRWWLQAVHDLDTAAYLLDGGRFSTACFHAQQAAEKALKAYLYGRGEEMVRGHSVAVLCQEAAAYDAEFAALLQDASPLDRNYIPTRYPNGLPGGVPYLAYNRSAAEEALGQCRKVLETVRRCGGL